MNRMRNLRSFALLLPLLAALAAAAHADPTQAPIDRGIVLRGTVVTMDSKRSILRNGGVLVRGGNIVATWEGNKAPSEASSAIEVDLGPKAVIFPGLINLHDHPTYDALNLWPAPSSHAQPQLGRPLGSEPYANRYQWGRTLNSASPEFLRLVDTPQTLLTNNAGLGLGRLVVKYAEVRALLGGETAIEGASDPLADRILIRNVEAGDLSGAGRIAARVQSIDALSNADRSSLLARMGAGQLDAWIVHLAEGVRDAERRPGDPISSRAEFATLRSKGLLTDETVIIHGVGLEPEDFAAMRTAASPRLDGSGDGLGAKLVWSPLSNLLLYGRTATIYQAIAAGVVVSLGTDWSPSGSRNLLDELKVADIALRDPRVLGSDRDLVPQFAITGVTDDARKAAEVALDRALVEMVTINPALAVRWAPYVGSVEPGKRADLLLITQGSHPSAEELPNSPYRALIDATEEDVRLVLVNGNPLVGDVGIMETLKPGDYEAVTSPAGCFEKAVDVTDPSVSQGMESFASIEGRLRDALTALGGDHPPAGGGPASLDNTYSYLKARIPGAGALTDAQFTGALALQFGLTPDGRLNMEAIQLSPALVEDDDFAFHLLGGDVVPGSRLIADDTPPFKLYASNLNQVGALGNPFEASAFRNRYFDFCDSEADLEQAAADGARSAAASAGSRGSGDGDMTLVGDLGAMHVAALSFAPNPARSRTRLTLDVPTPGPVRVDVYDLAGRLVKTVIDRRLGPGRFTCGWDLSSASCARLRSALYLVRMRTPWAEVVTRLAVLP